VLFLWGERDTRYQSPEAAAAVAAEIPCSRFRLVPGGHAPYLDAAGRCAELIAQFVGCRVREALGA
jgi:pimeloyl-ACP methyl ester carboxylesterase